MDVDLTLAALNYIKILNFFLHKNVNKNPYKFVAQMGGILALIYALTAYRVTRDRLYRQFFGLISW